MTISIQTARNPRVFALMLRVLQVLARALALLITLLLCVPVALLPLATAVPEWVWVSLVAVDVGLIVLQFRLAPVWRGIAVSAVGTVVAGFVAVVASQLYASTPAIEDVDGHPIPGSIAVLEKVTLDGSEQWVSIRGKDASKPVLLFLAGGPGGTDMAVTRTSLGGLEESFVVVNWDQPGAGKSFDAVPHGALGPERYVADAHALTLQLRERFGQDKIYVLGESWGSVLGIWLVQRYPELYYAFAGTGQMVAFKENDILCYEFALKWAEERGDSEKVEKLKSLGPPPYYGDGVAQKESVFLLDTYKYMNENPAVIRRGNTLRDMAGVEYGLYDKLNYLRGVLDTLNAVYPQLWDVDLRQQAAQLEVPVYFLKGRHDVNAPVELTEEYYNVLSAPHKELIWFERSGHNPWISEPDKFVDVMVNTVLADTLPEDQRNRVLDRACVVRCGIRR